MMSARFLGVGPGVIIIVVIWILALFVTFIYSKVKKSTPFVGVLAVTTATLFTTILLCIPRERKAEVVAAITTEQDTLFIWRIALLALELASCLAAVIFMITGHVATPIKAEPLKLPTRGIISCKSR